jgi:hypothetical protein
VTEVGSAYVTLLPSAKGFGSKLSNELEAPATGAGRRAGKRAGEGIHAGLRSPLKKIGGLLAGAFVVDRAVGFFKEAIEGASDLSESASKVQVVFGKNGAIVTKFARTAAVAMGITEQAALEASGSFGNLFVALKLPQRESAKMSTSLVKLAGDLASFNNVDPAEALLALRSGLVGETEPMRKFGVNMNDATLKAKALKLGLIDSVKDALTPAAKAQAAYALILEQTTTAQGDFTRTSGGLANQQRIMAAQWGDLKAKIGQQLLPVMVDLAHFTNEEIIPAISGFVDGIKDGTGAGGQFADAVGDIGDGLQTAWKIGKPFLSFIAGHPKLFTEIAVGAGGFALAMKTLGGVKKFPGLGSLLGGKGAPLPVFVTNMGVGGLGVGGKGGVGKAGAPASVGRLAMTAGTVTMAGQFILSAAVAKEIGTAAGQALDTRADKNLTETQKVARGLVEQTLKDLGTSGKGVLGDTLQRALKDAAAALKGDKSFQTVRGPRGKDTVNLVKAYDFLVKYGSKTEEVQATLRALAKDPIVARALRDRAKDAKRLEDLLTGGLSRTKKYANAAGDSVATAFGPKLSAAAINARERLNDVRDRANNVSGAMKAIPSVKPKVELVGASGVYDWATRIGVKLDGVGAKKPKPVVSIAGGAAAEGLATRLEHVLERVNREHYTAFLDVKANFIGFGRPSPTREQGYATGTMNAPAGWAWVGEEGPELRRIRGGDQIAPHSRSVEMAQADGKPNVTYAITMYEAGQATEESLTRSLSHATFLLGS